MTAPGGNPDWHDLSTNRPGQAVHKKARDLQQDAPVKTILARILGAPREERDYRVGGDGEVEVGRRLSKLSQGWHVLHAIPVGTKGGDIDHVVIGLPGVFTLNTKNHSRGRVWVAEQSFMLNGQPTKYLRNSRYEAKRAAGYLSSACGFPVDVHPLIVVMAASFTVKAQPQDVTVVARKRIVKWLTARPTVLSGDQVGGIYEYARRDTTWR